MAIINLRDFYLYYTMDSFIEVPDEVAEAMAEFDRRDSISIESQIDFCKYGLKGGSCKIFKDKGCSGQNTDRPEFQRLLDEIRKGKVRRVIVYKLDRIPSCSATRYTRRPTWNCMNFSRARERQSSMTPPTSPGQMAAISTRGGT